MSGMFWVIGVRRCVIYYHEGEGVGGSNRLGLDIVDSWICRDTVEVFLIYVRSSFLLCL